jgi:tyrosinase
MSSPPKPQVRIRRSIEAIQNEYTSGKKAELEALMRAWRGIKALPPTDPDSFFIIGGFHGEPFRGAGAYNPNWWGGYCNHGNVLFPTWHRAYLNRLEDALRRIEGCENVTLPYWDETSQASREKGVPWALTVEKFELDGELIENPLRSFTLNAPIVDQMASTDPAGADYSKPLGYTTVRYPLSGLVGPSDKAATDKHNAQWPSVQGQIDALDTNIENWLGASITVNGKRISTTVADLYELCLDAPNYTVFSNLTSATQWSKDHGAKVVPVEQPHNDIHLAVGGWDVPSADYSPIQGANGDMGENDTAALDPIFYFHHCFVDRMFWLWQQRHKSTDTFDVIPAYPGTNSMDGGGQPTAGVAAGIWLTMDSPLAPFTTEVDGERRPTTSRDVINIETQLGYTYEEMSSPAAPGVRAAMTGGSAKAVHVEGIDRSKIRGSFLISAFAKIDGKRYYVGSEAVLSRWHVEGCANCQTHLKARAVIGLHKFSPEMADSTPFEIEVRTRDGILTGHPALSGAGQHPFRFVVR